MLSSTTATVLTSVSVGGTLVDANFRSTQDGQENLTGGYILSATATAGPMVVNYQFATAVQITIFDAVPSGGVPVLDAVGDLAVNTGLSSPFPGVPLTLTGNNDIVIQGATANCNVSAVNSPWSTNASFATDETGAGSAAVLNVSSFTPPNWTCSGVTNVERAAMAFGFGALSTVPTSMQDGSGGVDAGVPTSATLKAGTYGATGLGSGSGANNWVWWSTNEPSSAFTFSASAHHANTIPLRFAQGGAPYADTGLVGFDLSTNATTLNYVTMWLPQNYDGSPSAATPTTSNTVLATFWFRTSLPQNASINCDCFALYGSGTGGTVFSNMILFGTGSTLTVGLEGAVSSGIAIASNTWYQISIQHQGQNGSGKIQVYDENGKIVGTQTPITNGSNPANRVIFGDFLGGNRTSGQHIQFDKVRICYVGCSGSDFPYLIQSHKWNGIISPARATDWDTQVGIQGFNNGTLPSASYTKCGATMASSSTCAQINSQLAGCSAKQYVLLGAGTFNFAGACQLLIPSNVVLRGSGANSTFLTGLTQPSQCGQLNASICLKSTDTNNVGSPSSIYTWTGFQQGTNQIVPSSVTSLNATDPTMLFLYQDNTGYTGAGSTPTGCAIDNGNLYVASDIYATSGCNNPNGASANGGGGSPGVQHSMMEMHTVTAVTNGVVSIFPPLLMPNYVSGQSPQLMFVKPIVNAGVENLSIDAGGVVNTCVEIFNGYHTWISGVRCLNAHFANFNLFEAQSSIVQNSYIYGNTASAPSGYGIRVPNNSTNLVVNNIIQQVLSPIFVDGPDCGSGIAYNYINNALFAGQDFMSPAITEHATDCLSLFEGNIANQISDDDIHGTAYGMTRFRNFLTGWESVPSLPKTSGTNAIADFPYARYQNNVANILGTPSFHTVYFNPPTNSGQQVYYAAGLGSIPTDALAKSTSMFWGNWDNVTNTIRWCGNSSDTGWVATCGSTSEIPTGASTYPNSLPTLGDTGAGQSGLPASLLYASRPIWYASSIPFPAIGPDVTSGNVGQCNGAPNRSGHFSLLPSISSLATPCPGGDTLITGWGGHVNAIPAMNCALITMGMPLDGTGLARNFDPDVCYAGAGGTAPAVTLTPTQPLDFGNQPVGIQSGAQVVTLTNTGTANLTGISVGLTIGSQFAKTADSCTSGTVTPSGTCTVTLKFLPTTAGLKQDTLVFTDNASDSPQSYAVQGTGVIQQSTGGSAITVRGTVIH